MAGSEGYSVGNLKIAFNALDQTSDDFKKLATNLRAIANLINRISTADLGKFTANVKQITQAFNPFLTQTKDTTDGLTALNSIIKQVGVQNLSGIVQSFDDIRRATQEAADGVDEYNAEVINGENATRELNNTSNAQDELNEKMRRYANIQESIRKIAHKETTPKTEILREIQVLIPQLEQARNKVEKLENTLEEASKQTFGNPDYAYGVAVDLERAREEYQQFANQIENLKTRFGTPFNEAQAQISKLTQEMLNLHFATGKIDDTVINQIVEQTNAVMASKKAIDETIAAKQREKMTDEELKIALQNETIAQYNAANAERKRLISYYEAKIAAAKAGESVKEYRKELERLKKEDGQVGKKSGFSKFLGRVKRIAIYSLIRAGLKAVTGAFKDGIGALAQFDSGVNKTMSQLTTSFTVMKLSVSMALVPLLQSITPIIQQISVGFANMANAISASMSKTGEYTKINTDRLLAYNKAANLFDFDKFRSLNKGDDAMNLLSTEKVEDFNDELGSSKLLYSGIFDIIKAIEGILPSIVSIVVQIVNAAPPILGVVAKVLGFVLKIVGGVVSFLAEAGRIEPILYGILTVLTLIGISKIVTWVQGGLTKALQGLIGLLKQFHALLSNINKFIHTTTGKFALWGIAVGAVVAAVKILSNWDDFSRGTKIAITVISSLVAVLTTAAIAALALKGALTSGIAVPLIVTAVAAGATAIGGMIKGYANGGMPDKGSLFVAGESGAEFVYNMPSGQSGVANVQQIAQAMKAGCLAALQEYGASRGDLGDISFDLDGEQIYRNTTSHAKKHGYAWRKV